MTSREMVAENRPRLRRLGHQVQDAGHVLDKAHIQHPVGLVQHHGLHLIQAHGAPLHMVHQPSRSGHHDLGGPSSAG